MWIAASVSLIFLTLSALHWYWAFGGQSGLKSALPSTGEKPKFKPGPLLTALVALLLMLAAGVCMAQAGIAGLPSSTLTKIGVSGLSLAFALRAIGDFRFVGIFKRVKGTSFARMDTMLFTPLCIIISVMCGSLI